MTIAISAGSASRVGRVRSLNEDSVLALNRVFVVADGMGGHAAGDRASQLTVGVLAHLDDEEELGTEDVLAAIERANAAILEEARSRPEQRGMGTTLTGMAMISMSGQAHWMVFNVGDSRTYQFIDGALQQLSVDHSETQELIDRGMITEDEARTHPECNVITRSLGTDPAPTPDQWLLPMHERETFLICSDGLTLELGEDEIAEIMAGPGSPGEVAQRLVGAAERAGGRDNVSVVVVRTLESGEVDAGSEDTRPRLITLPEELR